MEPSFETTRKCLCLDEISQKRKEGFDVPRAEDPRGPHAAYFWYSKDFETSVWTPPWDPKLFEVQEVERDVFLEVCLDEFLLPNSPFGSLLDKLPTDLWPNAGVPHQAARGGYTHAVTSGKNLNDNDYTKGASRLHVEGRAKRRGGTRQAHVPLQAESRAISGTTCDHLILLPAALLHQSGEVRLGRRSPLARAFSRSY